MPGAPGVYRMIDHREDILYVGKAKNLRKRVANYTHAAGLSNRLRRMVASTVRIEVITTESEVEALLLESNLIKKLKPTYNIVLRDDKSYPYILITDDHTWPQIMKYRGARKKSGEYFGPFASAGAVNQTINALHRAFPLRSCSDGVFSGRTCSIRSNGARLPASVVFQTPTTWRWSKKPRIFSRVDPSRFRSASPSG